MAFESLTDKLQNVFKKLRSKGRLTEEDVKIALKEVKMALLEADVNFRVVKQFTKSVQERAVGQDVMNGLNPGQMVIKIVNEEMVKLINRSYNRMLSFSTDGTFSARVSQDQFLVTPKGLDRMNLRNDELVLIQDNYREMGKIPSRAAGFFKAIYDTHPWVNAIIVSKPVNVMGYAVTEEKIDTKTIPESYILLRDIVDIPCAEHYKDPMATVKKIAPNAPVIMLRNDCLLTVGSTLLQAFDRLEVAEFCANSLLASKRLGGVKPINEEQKKDLIKAFHLPE